MDEPIEDVYFNWLYAKVAYRAQPTPSNRFQSLLYFMHRTEFVWRVSGDDNRAEDGRGLRQEFLYEIREELAEPLAELECSVLEMMIAFSRRAAFQTDMTPLEWFWIMLENLGIAHLCDSEFDGSDATAMLGQILEDLVWRRYDEKGRGGLFPLRNPSQDQREVEIWYQFCEYLVDQGIF